MFSKSVMRRLMVTALVVALLAPAGTGFADGSQDGTDVSDQSSFFEDVLEWLIGLVDTAESNPTDGDNGPTVDPAG